MTEAKIVLTQYRPVWHGGEVLDTHTITGPIYAGLMGGAIKDGRISDRSNVVFADPGKLYYVPRGGRIEIHAEGGPE